MQVAGLTHIQHTSAFCIWLCHKFSPLIRVFHFDVISCLCFDECFVMLVGIDGLALLCLEIEYSFVGCVIYACCHV